MPLKILCLLPFFCCLLILSLPSSIKTALHLHVASFFASHQRSTSCEPEVHNASFATWAGKQEKELEEAYGDAEAFMETTRPFHVATVIFQSHTPWSNSLWIDVGYATENVPFAVKKNCPILVQDIVVGMVDFVGKNASRVRLLSDPSLHIAVRVVRGNEQTARVLRAATDIHKALKRNPKLMPKPELATALGKLLECIPLSLRAEKEVFLAKGELQGAEQPSRPNVFRGIGFNYDFSDDEGSKRDLRFGQQTLEDQKQTIIMPGDVLQTSGLDGVFPKGLRVATVKTVFPLEEGSISYQILATSEHDSFPQFDYVTVISALPEEPLSPPSTEELLMSLITENDR